MDASKTSFMRVIWRFSTGAHLDGIRRTNATWLTHGNAPKSNLTWWNRKPRAHRMLWRWITISLLAFQIWGLVSFRILLSYLDVFVLGLVVEYLYTRFGHLHLPKFRVSFKPTINTSNHTRLPENVEREAIDAITIDGSDPDDDIKITPLFGDRKNG